MQNIFFLHHNFFSQKLFLSAGTTRYRQGIQVYTLYIVREKPPRAYFFTHFNLSHFSKLFLPCLPVPLATDRVYRSTHSTL